MSDLQNGMVPELGQRIHELALRIRRLRRLASACKDDKGWVSLQNLALVMEAELKRLIEHAGAAPRSG